MGLLLSVLQTSLHQGCLLLPYSNLIFSCLKTKQVLPVQAQPWDFLATRSTEPCKKSLWVKVLAEFQMLHVGEGALLCSLSFGGSLLFMGQRAA